MKNRHDMKVFCRTLVGDIPIWAVMKLGCEVVLSKPYDAYGDGSFVLMPGVKGILDGIQRHSEGARALVILEEDAGTAWDIPFHQLTPVL